MRTASAWLLLRVSVILSEGPGASERADAPVSRAGSGRGEPEQRLRTDQTDVVAERRWHDPDAPSRNRERDALDLPPGGFEPAVALGAREAAADDDELRVEDVDEADGRGRERAPGTLHDRGRVLVARVLRRGNIACLKGRRRKASGKLRQPGRTAALDREPRLAGDAAP